MNATAQIEKIEVLSQIDGKIIEQNVTENEAVKKGQILVRIDSRRQKDKIDSLQKMLDKKQKELKKHNFIINNASDENEKLAMEIEQAKNNLENVAIQAATYIAGDKRLCSMYEIAKYSMDALFTSASEVHFSGNEDLREGEYDSDTTDEQSVVQRKS